MNDPVQPIRIEPDAIYDDGAIILSLGITHSALTQARRSGNLRFNRSGKRVLYRGQWILDWLENGAISREGGLK